MIRESVSASFASWDAPPCPPLPPLNTYFFVFWEKNPNTTILYSIKQRPSVHGHALQRGRSSVWFPAKQTGPTRRYEFPLDLRSQTVRAWLVLVGNQHYCCVVWLLHCWFFSSWLMNSCSKQSLPGSNSGKGFIFCLFLVLADKIPFNFVFLMVYLFSIEISPCPRF